jgi:hypothetical protein
MNDGQDIATADHDEITPERPIIVYKIKEEVLESISVNLSCRERSVHVRSRLDYSDLAQIN